MNIGIIILLVAYILSAALMINDIMDYIKEYLKK
jgi:hypothetical protein